MTLDLDRLEALAKDAPQGKWEIWTSNSWRRIYADQGREKVRVIEPAVHSDGWPDLMFGPGVEAWMEGFTSEVALALIAEVRALREDAERWRTEMELRNDPTVAIMFAGTNNRCCIYRGGVLIAPGSTYAEAIDAARKEKA